MLEVKIDLVPFGREEGRRTIHQMFIWNDGRIEGDLCKYLACETDPRTDYKMALNDAVTVKHYRSDGAWALVEAVRKKMNKLKSRGACAEASV